MWTTLFTDNFPGRTWVPKTLIFAKDEAEIDKHPVDGCPPRSNIEAAIVGSFDGTSF